MSNRPFDISEVKPGGQYTIKQVADMLGVTPNAVYKLIERGRLIAGKRFGGSRRYISGQRLIEGFQGRELPT